MKFDLVAPTRSLRPYGIQLFMIFPFVYTIACATNDRRIDKKASHMVSYRHDDKSVTLRVLDILEVECQCGNSQLVVQKPHTLTPEMQLADGSQIRLPSARTDAKYCKLVAARGRE
jgi:hypothetical protein